MPAIETLTKKSDEILDELFNKIVDDSGDSESSSSDEGKDEDSDEEERRRKHKKKKKKHKKEKKKKKKKDRSKDSDEEADGFWGAEDPYDKSRVKKEDDRDKRSDRHHSKPEDHYDRKDDRRSARPEDYDRRHQDKYHDDYAHRGSHEEYDRRERYEGYDRHRDLLRGDDRGGDVHHSSQADRYTEREREERASRKERSSRDKAQRDRYDRDERSERSRDERKRDRERVEEKKRDTYDRRSAEKSGKREKDEERSSRGESGRGDRNGKGSSSKGDDKKGKGEDKEKESGGGDGFWDTKWDAMVLEDRIQKGEKRGRYYLNTNKRFKDATGENKEGTPSLTPSPERIKKKKGEDSESDTEEYKRLKKRKEIQNLQFDGDGMVTGSVPDPANYEYDKVTMMYRKKAGMVTMEDNRAKGKKGEGEKKGSDSSDEDSDSSQKKKKSEDKEDKSDSDEVKIKKEKESVAEDLMKEIEDLENEIVVKTEVKKEVDDTKESIDWSSSALGHLKQEEKEKNKKKRKSKKEEDSGKEEGEVELSSSEDEKRKSKKRKKSRSRSRRRSYSRGRDSRGHESRGREDRDSRGRDRDTKSSRHVDRQSREAWGLESSRSSRHRSRSRDDDRSAKSRRSRSPYDRVKRERYDRKRSRSRSRGGGADRRAERRRRSRSRSRESRDGSHERERDELYERNKRRQERHLRSKINKERLLEIAKKNAAKILKSGGDFMGLDEDRLIAMKAGGQNLDELTKFCKELAKKGLEDKEKIQFLAESESESDEEFRHPFMVKDKPLPNPITMLLGAGEKKEVQLPPAAKAVAKSQRMLEFPVSSGNAHRQKIETTGEEPLAIENKERLALEMQTDADEMLRFHEQLEAEEKAAKIGTEVIPWKLNKDDEKITVPNPVGKDLFNGDIKELPAERMAEIEKLKPKPVQDRLKALAAPTQQLALPAPGPTDPIPPMLSSDPNKVYEMPEAPVVDIGTIVSKRLNAQRKLQQNPEDAEALKEMYDAQKQMEMWAMSKNKPGQFVGSTGASIMKKHELNNGLHAWARKDQFDNAQRVRGGFGEFMLKKMGWEEGDGLGKNLHGEKDPLQLDIKFDKKGLSAADEGENRGVVTLTGCKDLAGKHPVSALTELCSKRRWGPPLFNEAFAVGPPHKKNYVYKVTVNGRDYMANVAVDNKKKAKSNAALVCLQTLGLVAKDPDNPV